MGGMCGIIESRRKRRRNDRGGPRKDRPLLGKLNLPVLLHFFSNSLGYLPTESVYISFHCPMLS